MIQQAEYKIYDSTFYSELDVMVPFTVVKECATMEQVHQYLDAVDNLNLLFFVADVDGNVIFDSNTRIYETPDEGHTTTHRRPFSNTKQIDE